MRAAGPCAGFSSAHTSAAAPRALSARAASRSRTRGSLTARHWAPPCNGRMDTPLEHAMTQQALVRGELRVRTAAGGEVLVPEGALEIEFSDGLAKLRW